MTTGDEIIASSIFRAPSSLHYQSVYPSVKQAGGGNKTCSLIKHVLIVNDDQQDATNIGLFIYS